MMKTAVLSVIAVILLAGTGIARDDEGLLTTDGKLKGPIEFRDGQGGFAGATGVAWKIDTDGSWTVANFRNETLKKKLRDGKLSARQLATLAGHLAALDVASLPKGLGDFTGANPHTFVLTIGDRTTTATLPAGARLSDVLLPEKESRAWSHVVAAAAIIQSWTAGDGPGK
jgi:hypothetical protein